VPPERHQISGKLIPAAVPSRGSGRRPPVGYRTAASDGNIRFGTGWRSPAARTRHVGHTFRSNSVVSRRTGRPAAHPPARQKPRRWCRQGGRRRRHSPNTRSPVLRRFPDLQRVIIPSVALCRCHGNVQRVLGRSAEVRASRRRGQARMHARGHRCDWASVGIRSGKKQNWLDRYAIP